MLIDQMQTLCQRLAPLGWQTLLQNVAGLNINQASATDLAAELARVLPAIDRNVPGFEDFNAAGNRGITPGVPSASLLYHALASPAVTARSLTGYPTLAELDLVENYIFATLRATFDTYRTRADGRRLGVVVYAYDYRPAGETVQGAYADWVLSRTGVQRVGNTAAAYVPELRAFTPWRPGDADAAVRVLPARYAAFLAVRLRGDDDELGTFGPLDTGMLSQVLADDTLFEMLPSPHQQDAIDDADNEFWVPLHKLFPGAECLTDFVADGGLTVAFEVVHRNQKLQRQWGHLASQGYALNLVDNNINAAPFVRDAGLAARSTDAADGPCLVVPVPHDTFNTVVNNPTTGAPLAFPVMADYTDFVQAQTGDNESYGWFWSSFYIPPGEGGAHRAPEYVNVRGRIEANGTVTNLNTLPGITGILEAGGFNAQTLQDFSADGWVAPLVTALLTVVDPADFMAAYSLVTAPAFFPFVRQRDLMRWSVDRFNGPNEEWAKVWNVLPVALCHDRIAPNIELAGSNFAIGDRGISAIVSLPAPEAAPLGTAVAPGLLRVSFLPDAAAGTYAPGWETSYDRDTLGDPFLAAYGLGSPFAEDAMICSALGTFWPGPAPDTSRLFAAMSYRTEAPLTDTEIGVPTAATSWDGTPAPAFQDDGSILFINQDYVDYTRSAVLRVKPFMAVTTREFTGRVLSMFNALAAVGVLPDDYDADDYRAEAEEWRVLMYRPSSTGDAGFKAAYQAARPRIGAAGPVYWMRIAQLDIIDDATARTAAGAAYNQILARIQAGTDFYLYTFAGGTLCQQNGTAIWTFVPAPR